MGKKSRSAFFFPKVSLSLICFGPSAVLVDNVKSGALVPTASGITILRLSFRGGIHYRIGNRWVKGRCEESEEGRPPGRRICLNGLDLFGGRSLGSIFLKNYCASLTL